MKPPIPPLPRIEKNPAHWPTEVLPLFEQAITCEFTTLTRAGLPITQPLTPYIGDDEQTLDVSTGLTYPAKAERARRNPKVAMLYSDPIGSGLTQPPLVLVQGLASVRDADLQSNMDRYLYLSLIKSPAGLKGAPALLLKQLPWYFTRIWLQVQPTKIFWWPLGDLSQPPQIWHATEAFKSRPSDPAPTGKQPPAWREAPQDWHANATHAIEMLGLPTLTTVDEEGYPVSLRAETITVKDPGFRLQMPTNMPFAMQGSGCLTFHTHPEIFASQENKTFVGSVEAEGDHLIFQVERALADWSISGSRISGGLGFLQNGFTLTPRLKAEAARRDQPIPRVHVPAFW